MEATLQELSHKEVSQNLIKSKITLTILIFWLLWKEDNLPQLECHRNDVDFCIFNFLILKQILNKSIKRTLNKKNELKQVGHIKSPYFIEPFKDLSKCLYFSVFIENKPKMF